MERQVEDRQRRKGWIRFLKAIAAIVAVSFVLARTQVMAQSTAQISGVVTDQSGAILPGVEVKVTQTDTGITRSAVTNETGLYILPNLPIGPYRLEAALPGFRSYVQTGIVLQVGSNPVLNMSKFRPTPRLWKHATRASAK